MISRKEIRDFSDKYNVYKNTIDQDWTLGHILNAIYSLEENRKNLVFKGGTALKKCYFKEYRFSEDLDFTLLDMHFPIDRSFVDKITNRATQDSL